MVYCNLTKHENGVLMYAVGGTPEDLTGKLRVDYKNKQFELLKKPEKTSVYQRHIENLLTLHQKEFEKGIFKNKIAYEI